MEKQCKNCSLNEASNDKRTACDCAKTFIRDENNSCICPAGSRYLEKTNGDLNECIECVGATYLPKPGLARIC